MKPKIWLALGVCVSVLLFVRSKENSESSSNTRSTPTGPVLDTGVASWYGPGFDGKLTASGEVFAQEGLSAAHRTLKLGTVVDVINLDNGRTVRLRVNDRGPFTKNSAGQFARVIDLSKGAARVLGFIEQGLARVEVRAVA